MKFASAYEVERNVDGGWFPIGHVFEPVFTAELDLQNSERYRVAASNRTGLSPYAEFPATSIPGPNAVASPMGRPWVFLHSDGVETVISWHPSEGVVAYVIDWKPDGQQEWETVGAASGASTSFLFVGDNRSPLAAFRVRGVRPGYLSVPSGSVQFSDFLGYGEWNIRHGASADAPRQDDEDGDGLSRWLEYAFGLEPTRFDAPPSPPRFSFGDSGKLRVEFDWLRPEIDYKLQLSSNLLDWEDIPVTTEEHSHSVEPVTVHTTTYIRIVAEEQRD